MACCWLFLKTSKPGGMTQQFPDVYIMESEKGPEISRIFLPIVLGLKIVCYVHPMIDHFKPKFVSHGIRLLYP